MSEKQNPVVDTFGAERRFNNEGDLQDDPVYVDDKEGYREDDPRTLNSYDNAIDTDIDFVVWVRDAFNEGIAAHRKAMLNFEQTGVFVKPENPYSKILLKLIRERNEVTRQSRTSDRSEHTAQLSDIP